MEWNHSYLDDLLVEFYEDYFEKNKDAYKEARQKHTGYEFGETGDTLFDHWERQTARGEVPDLDIDEPENAKKRDEYMREKAQRYFEIYGERYRAHEAPDFAEVARVAQDEFNLDLSSFAGELPDGISGALANISPEAFDEFINAIGAIKKD